MEFIVTIATFVGKNLANYFLGRGFTKLFTNKKTFVNALSKVINSSIDEFATNYSQECIGEKFPFYMSQRIVDELLQFRIMKDYNKENLYTAFKEETNVIPPTRAELELFYSIFIKKINEDTGLSKLEIQETFQDEIFHISEKIDIGLKNLDTLSDNINRIERKIDALTDTNLTKNRINLGDIIVPSKLCSSEKLSEFTYRITAIKQEFELLYQKNPENSQIISISSESLIEQLREDASTLGQIKSLYELEIFYAYTLINTGETNKILKAQKIIEDILFMIEGSNLVHDKLYEKVKWLYSITYCLNNDIDKALNICEEGVRKLKGNNLILNREIFILTKDAKLLGNILSQDTISQYDIVEEFHTYRRLFEYYLFHCKKNNKELEVCYKRCDLLFKVVRNRLDKIYEFMYYKDLFVYFSLIKNDRYAKINYSKAYNGFVNHGFSGQLIKIENIKNTLKN